MRPQTDSQFWDKPREGMYEYYSRKYIVRPGLSLLSTFCTPTDCLHIDSEHYYIRLVLLDRVCYFAAHYCTCSDRPMHVIFGSGDRQTAGGLEQRSAGMPIEQQSSTVLSLSLKFTCVRAFFHF